MRRQPLLLPVVCFAMWVAALGGCAPSRSVCGDAELAAKLDAVLKGASRGAMCSARVLELPNGRELYAHAADEPVIPASNMKLLISAAALDRFGPDHTFKTYLAVDGDDLWLIGTGDPGCGDPRIASWSGLTPTTMLENWAQALRNRGITRIRGNLYFDDGALDKTWVHLSWNKSFLVEWFAAPVSGLNFNDNCIDVTVKPAADGKPVLFEVMPPVRDIQVINNCITGGKDAPDITRAPDANVFTLTGSATKPAKVQSKPVTDPGAFFADALRTHLSSRGITIDGRTIRATWPVDNTTPPPPHKLVAIHETRLKDAIWRINKNSQNLFAEAVCKLLGQQHEADRGRRVTGSWESGSRAVLAFLREHGIDDRRIVVADGSGLGRDNRVTARALTDLLAVMFGHPSGQMFRESLSVAGTDGTLAPRMKDLGGAVIAKTGFIGGVCSLSGYVRTRGGQWLAFSIIFNRFEGDEKPYQQLQDEACRILVNWTP